MYPIPPALLAIDIPIGLLDGTRACDTAARKLLGQPRGSSVFPSPCRAAIQVASYGDACDANELRTGRKLSRQTWGIAPKIKQVDDAMTTACQDWAFEVPSGSLLLGHERQSAYAVWEKEQKRSAGTAGTPAPGLSEHRCTRRTAPGQSRSR